MIWMLEHLKLSRRFLSLSPFFEFLFLHSVLVGCLFLPFVWNHWFEYWFPSLHCWFPVYSFISLCIALISVFILWPNSIICVRILITSVLNSASDRLSIFLSLSSFSGVLICSFIWSIFLCLGAPLTIWCKGLSLRYLPGWGNLLCCVTCCLWGWGQRGNNSACWALPPLSVPSSASHKWIVPSQVIPRWVGLCMLSDPVGHSKGLFCETGSFSQPLLQAPHILQAGVLNV